MDVPEYITISEVKRICEEIGLSDWSELTGSTLPQEEAAIVLNIVNTQGMNIPLEEFHKGLEVELEHGTRYEDANVTNNHPILTGKIVLAHLLESLDYYQRLEVVEIEGDLLKAVVTRNAPKIESLYRKLLNAKRVVSQIESKQID